MPPMPRPLPGTSIWHHGVTTAGVFPQTHQENGALPACRQHNGGPSPPRALFFQGSQKLPGKLAGRAPAEQLWSEQLCLSSEALPIQRADKLLQPPQ